MDIKLTTDKQVNLAMALGALRAMTAKAKADYCSEFSDYEEQLEFIDKAIEDSLQISEPKEEPKRTGVYTIKRESGYGARPFVIIKPDGSELRMSDGKRRGYASELSVRAKAYELNCELKRAA